MADLFRFRHPARDIWALEPLHCGNCQNTRWIIMVDPNEKTLPYVKLECGECGFTAPYDRQPKTIIGNG